MIRHIVLFKLKNRNDRGKAIDAFNSMRGKIEGLIDLEAGIDFLSGERSYDIALICTFKDRAAFDAYQEHPAHLPVKKLMHEIREKSVACDFFI